MDRSHNWATHEGTPLRWRAILWAPPLLYAALIFYVSSQSDPMPSVTTFVWDKALHMVEYAVLAVLLGRALRGEGLKRSASAVIAIVAASAYGVTDEWHQMLVSGRESDLYDGSPTARARCSDRCGSLLRSYKPSPVVNRVSKVPIGSEKPRRR